MLREWFSARLRGFVRGPQKGSFSAKKNRTQLSERQREIAQRLQELFAAYEERLSALSGRIRGLDDDTFLQEASIIQQAQTTLLGVLCRAELADQETRVLIDEWRDWERLSSYGSASHAEREERQEMLRSELALRGVDVAPRQVAILEEEETVVPPPAFPSMTWNESKETEDHLEEWNEIQTVIVPESVAYWNGRLHEVLSADVLPETEALYALVKRFREAHGEQKLLDRKTGQRRYRLEAFS